VIQATGGTYLEAPARTALADTKIALALYAEAVRDYEKVTESDPRHARAYMGLAAAYAQLSDAPNMAMAMRRLIDLDPNIYETRVYFSDYPEDRKDLEIYLDAFRAFEGQPDDASIVQSSMAIVAYHLGDLKATDTHAKAAIKDDPKNAAALLYLGASALRRRAPGRAVDALKRAHAANRLHHVTKYMLGSAQLAAGQSEQARTLLEDVYENKPNFLPAVVALADIARKRKEKDRARELYRQAFKADVDLLTAKRGLFLLGD
jgi:tetratricopeptide (TPR) repeat protein